MRSLTENRLDFLNQVTTQPGVYIMRGTDGSVLYVGKAKNLKKRISSYLRPIEQLDRKTQSLVTQIANIDFKVTVDEQASLLLERELIKELMPRYNVMLRDDKSYPYIMISADKFPLIAMHRGDKEKSCKYYGPFANIQAVRSSLDVLHKVFLLRQCSNTVFKGRSRPCLQYQINRCSAPCVNYISADEYNLNVKYAKMFLKGKLQPVLNSLQESMARAAEKQDYEQAAILRDKIAALHPIITNRTVKQHSQDLSDGYSELSKALKITDLDYLECFDISHTMGQQTVASCVVFGNNGPNVKQYRRFKIKTDTMGDDYAAMREVLLRRYTKLLAQKERLPQVIIVDGGKGQLNIAAEIMKQLNIIEPIILGIAKGQGRKPGLETVYLQDHSILKLSNAALNLLQYIRNEAHRFAISFHRKKRSAKTIQSVLEQIPGVGKARRLALLQHFGGLPEIKNANINAIMKVPGINKILAEEIYSFLREH